MPYVTTIQRMDKTIVPMGSVGGFAFIKGGFEWGVLVKFVDHTDPVELTWAQLEQTVKNVEYVTTKGAEQLYDSSPLGPGTVMVVGLLYEFRIGNFAVKLTYPQLTTLREGLEASKNFHPINQGVQPNG